MQNSIAHQADYKASRNYSVGSKDFQLRDAAMFVSLTTEALRELGRGSQHQRIISLH